MRAVRQSDLSLPVWQIPAPVTTPVWVALHAERALVAWVELMVPRATQSKKFWPSPLLCLVWQLPEQQPGATGSASHSQPSVFDPVVELQSARPALQVYAHLPPVVQEGEPVDVLHAVPQPPQLVTEKLVSQPSVFGAVPELQSSFPAAQLYEHFVPSQVGVPVAVLHVVPHVPQFVTLVFEVSQPSRFAPLVALQSSSPAAQA